MLGLRKKKYASPWGSSTHMLPKYSSNRKRKNLMMSLLILTFIGVYEIWTHREESFQFWRSRSHRERFLQRHTNEQGITEFSPTINSHSSMQETADQELTSTFSQQPVVGKVTISFGEPDAVYERAINSHAYHNLRMGYPQFLLKERILPGLWSKHAYIFSILVEELSKPKSQRLQWLM